MNYYLKEDMKIFYLGLMRMNDQLLVCNSEINLVFDNDCLASFIWIKRLDILVFLYENRMFVPQVVVDELSYMKRYKKYKWVYYDLLKAIKNKIFKVIKINIDEKAFGEYSILRKEGKGKGESAAIAIAKTMDNYTACNNLRDIRPYIKKGEINNLVTLDILYEYYIKADISICEIDKILNDMRSKKRDLPDINFAEYLKKRESAFM